MDFVIDWVTNIILFILLAAIVEMLLPNSSMQRYVKMVASLLLLVILLNPLLSIFSLDVNEWLSPLVEESENVTVQLESSIEKKKSEIELGQRAYISEQMAVQMKRQVESELEEKFSLQVNEVSLSLDEFAFDTLDDAVVEHVVVSLAPTEAMEELTTNAVETVEVVMIDTNSALPSDNEVEIDLQPIGVFLSERWHIPEEQILFAWEGGEPRHEFR